MMGKSKKVASYRVNDWGDVILITKYDIKKKQHIILFEKRFKKERPDMYTYLNSAKRIKEFMN